MPPSPDALKINFYIFFAFTIDISDKAVEAGIKIVVLYKSTIVNKSKCPAAVKNRGTHVAMIYKGDDGKYYLDYQAVKKALQ